MLATLSNPVVVCHSHADIDAVCSGLIIANRVECKLYVPDYMTAHTKRVVEKIVPKKCQRIITGESSLQAGVLGNDMDIIVVDSNTPEMTGVSNCKVLIDHHPNPTIKAEHYFIDTYSSSTCEIIARYLALNVNTWEPVAAAAGIIDDTNILRSVSPHTLQVLALLVNSDQYNRLLELMTQHYSSTGEKVNVIKTLRNSEVHVVMDKVILKVGAKHFDHNIAERLTHFADVVILYNETDDGISVMLRTRDVPVHCGELLHYFKKYGCSAGGHKHAASMTCPLMDKNVVNKVFNKIKDILKEN